MLLTPLALSVVASPSAGGFTVWNECPCSNETLCQPIQTPRTQEDVYAFHTNSPSNVFGKNNQSWRVSNTHSLQLGYNARSRMTLRCQCRARTLKSQATATKTTCANKIGTCIYLPLPPTFFSKIMSNVALRLVADHDGLRVWNGRPGAPLPCTQVRTIQNSELFLVFFSFFFLICFFFLVLTL